MAEGAGVGEPLACDGTMPAWAKPKGETPTVGLLGVLLGVALRAEPRDLAVSVHPVVGIGLAGKPSDFSLLAAWIVRLDRPVVVCNPNDPEGHFCFCHGALCSLWPQVQALKPTKHD